LGEGSARIEVSFRAKENVKNLLLPFLPGLLYNAPFVAITGQFTNNITQNQADNHREGNEDDLRHADLPEKDPKRHNLRVLEEDYEYQYHDHKRNDYFRFFHEFLKITAFLFLHL
jgi:hypothetical protein